MLVSVFVNTSFRIFFFTRIYHEKKTFFSMTFVIIRSNTKLIYTYWNMNSAHIHDAFDIGNTSARIHKTGTQKHYSHKTIWIKAHYRGTFYGIHYFRFFEVTWGAPILCVVYTSNMLHTASCYDEGTNITSGDQRK